MTALEKFWLTVGDRIKIGAPPAERSLEIRRVLAARAFERWRTGRLEIEAPELLPRKSA
jgi:hypothetical protein